MTPDPAATIGPSISPVLNAMRHAMSGEAGRPTGGRAPPSSWPSSTPRIHPAPASPRRARRRPSPAVPNPPSGAAHPARVAVLFLRRVGSHGALRVGRLVQRLGASRLGAVRSGRAVDRRPAHHARDEPSGEAPNHGADHRTREAHPSRIAGPALHVAKGAGGRGNRLRRSRPRRRRLHGHAAHGNRPGWNASWPRACSRIASRSCSRISRIAPRTRPWDPR